MGNSGTKLKPSDIYYSADSVSNQVRYSSFSVGKTLDMYCEGHLDINSIRAITVRKVGEKWYTINDRHLWIYKHLERLGFLSKIPIQVTEDPIILKNTSAGKKLTIKDGPGGVWYKKWSTWGKVRAYTIAALVLTIVLCVCFSI